MNKTRKLFAGVAVAAATALALPGTAAAQASPQVTQEYGFQFPSLPIAAGTYCGGGLFGLSLPRSQASTDSVGNTTFGMTFDYVGDGAGPNLGSVTVGWLNVSTFQGGVTQFPLNDIPSSFQSRGAVSVHTGTGQIVAIMQPDVSFFGEHCNWSFSLGTFPA